jgi:AAA domain
MRRAIDIEPRVVRWLWFDRIPRGMISIVAGMPSGGKSLFTVYLAAKVSHQADVVLCASEDLEHEMLRAPGGRRGEPPPRACRDRDHVPL